VDLAGVRHRLRETLERLRAPEGYLRAGTPRYFTLFGRDSLISSWQTLSEDPSIAAATLRILASFQGRRRNVKSEEEPGKILHEHRFRAEERMELPDWEFPYYGSVDSTPLFLIVADAYLTSTGDEEIVDRHWNALKAAYRWMLESGDRDGDGYIEYAKQNPRGLTHQGWKDGSEDHLRISPPAALVEVQGYAVAAHRAMSRLARRQDESVLADHAEHAALVTREALNRDFWMPDRKFFGLALDGSKRLRMAVTSNPGHLLLADAVIPEKVDAVVRRLFQEDMWTPYGVRTHATTEPDFNPYGYHTGTVWPHDNWFLYRGLRAHGREAEASQIRTSLLQVWEELGKIPELYAVVDDSLVDLSKEGSPTPANPVQAWSSAGLLDMIREDD
jgi:glycogen debranching enzyme